MTTPKRKRMWMLTSTLALLTVSIGAAQTAPVAKTGTDQTSSTAAAVDDDDTVVLSPFTVSPPKDSEGYQVQDTLAGTRVKTKLSDLGSAITVVNAKFMSDIGANNAQSLLQYTTNTEVGGVRGNFGGMGNGSQLSETTRLLQPDNNTRVRGLTAADNTRNYFNSSIPWDGFNIDRVDMQRGPNAMLFGNGSPAGIINTSLNDASYQTQGKVQNRVGIYGSLRNIVDLNYVLLPKELAIRVVGLDDNERYEQEGTYNHQKRIYAALRYDPKWLDFEGAHTTIKINDENGTITSRNPRTLTPVDKITPWFTALGQKTYNPYTIGQTGNPVLNNAKDANGLTRDEYAYLYGGGQGRILWSNIVESYGNPNNTVHSTVQADNVNTGYGIGQANNKDSNQATTVLPTALGWATTGKIAGIGFAEPRGIVSYSQYAANKGLLGSNYGEYRDKLLTDPSIFDFYKKTLDGPNSHQYQDWNGFNAELSQTFLNNRIGLDLAFYSERYTYGGEDYLTGTNYSIGIDLNTVNQNFITDPTNSQNSTKNANIGRPYISSDGVYGNSEVHDQRNSSRAQLFGDLRSSDFTSSPLLQEILGHHQFTGVLSKDSKASTAKSWARWDAASDWVSAIKGSQSITGSDRNIDIVSYIGPSLLTTTSASGINLSGLTVTQQPGTSVTTTYFDSHWKYSLNPSDPTFKNPNAAYSLPDYVVKYSGAVPSDYSSNQSQNPANYVGWTNGTFKVLNADAGDINQLYLGGSKSRTAVKSEAFTWQGSLFDDTLVPAFGWRKDKVTLAQKSAPVLDSNQNLVDPINYTAGDVVASDEAQSRTWSLVYKAPKFIKKYLPLGGDFSLFYDKSSNFEAQSIRKDYLGNNIPDASGKTTEYGFIVSAFTGKVSLKVAFYDTKVTNATLTGGDLGAKAYELALLPAWGVATAAQCYAGLTNTTIDHGTSVQDKPWFWDYAWGSGVGNYGAARPQTDPRAAAADAAELATIKAFADNSMPQSFYDTYGMPVNVAAMQAGNWNDAVTQAGYVSSGGGSIQSSNGNTANGVAPSIIVDTESKGIEFELYAQPLPNWNITLNAAKDKSTNTNLGTTMIKIINMEKNLYDSAAGDLHLWGAQGETFRTIFYRDIYGPYVNFQAQEGTQVSEMRPWHVNVISSYYFDKGFAKGFSVGGAYHWADKEILGYHLDENATLADGSANLKYGWLDTNRPWKSSTQHSFDLWIGYKRELSRKLTWEIQLNLQNVGQKDKLVPISVEPNDGSWAEVRIVSGQSWQVTNTLRF